MTTPTYLLTCIDCGTPFFTPGEKQFYEAHNLYMPKRCRKCRVAKKVADAARVKGKADKVWEEEEQKAIARLLYVLPYQQAARKDIKIEQPGKTLYVIGNGFDIMHGALSGYGHFRDSMGKHNVLRNTLETYITVDSLWSDFEEALAHIDGGAMYGVADMWLDIFGAYDSNATAADFFAAAESAASPAQTILNKLPGRFRQWIESIEATKPEMLGNIIKPEGRFLNFNYTEFLETLYGVPEDHICYIHGCRKNKKQKLILGHAPGAGDEDDFTPHTKPPRYKSGHKREKLNAALETTSGHLADYDAATTKRTEDIIRRHVDFFDSLADIREIVVIGHSLSVVDYPYFAEIMKGNTYSAKWMISWYSAGDLQRIDAFVKRMGIPVEKVQLFC